jgi:hypothetical protein
MTCSSVDLPDPEGPTIATSSPRRTEKAHPPQGEHRGLLTIDLGHLRPGGDPFDREDPFEASVPGADDDPFDPVLPFAAKLFETPAPISATVARAASGRSFLVMFHSFVS